MKAAHLKAYKQLQAIGAPVYLWEDVGRFVISAEENSKENLWAHCDMEYMNPSIVSILKANKLDYEWYDGGTAMVHQA